MYCVKAVNRGFWRGIGKGAKEERELGGVRGIAYTTASFLVFGGHHLGFAGRPLAWRAAFVALVYLFLDLVAEVRVCVFVLGSHCCGY